MLPINSIWLQRLAVCLSLVSIAASPSKRKQPVVLSDAEAARILVYAPHPEYPAEARRARISGSGWFLMILDDTGHVTQVHVTKSTGSRILDAGAVQTLAKWRFKPGLGIRRANLPITFRLDLGTR